MNTWIKVLKIETRTKRERCVWKYKYLSERILGQNQLLLHSLESYFLLCGDCSGLYEHIFLFDHFLFSRNASIYAVTTSFAQPLPMSGWKSPSSPSGTFDLHSKPPLTSSPRSQTRRI